MVVPVGQDVAFAHRAVDDVLVARGAVRVAVDHPQRRLCAQRRHHGVGRDVHDRLGLQRLFVAALAAQPPRDDAPDEVGEAQQPRLRRGVAHPRAVRLVLRRRRCTARRRGRAACVRRPDSRSRSPAAGLRPRPCAKRSPSRKSRLPRPTNNGTPAAEIPAQRRDDGRDERIGHLVVAHPPVEEVAQDVHGLRGTRGSGCERMERGERPRTIRRKVQVGEKQRRAGGGGHLLWLQALRPSHCDTGPEHDSAWRLGSKATLRSD